MRFIVFDIATIHKNDEKLNAFLFSHSVFATETVSFQLFIPLMLVTHRHIYPTKLMQLFRLTRAAQPTIEDMEGKKNIAKRMNVYNRIHNTECWRARCSTPHTTQKLFRHTDVFVYTPCGAHTMWWIESLCVLYAMCIERLCMLC